MNNGVMTQPDPLQNNYSMGDGPVSFSITRIPPNTNLIQFDFQTGLEFGPGQDVLQDFDFDSFLHQDGEDNNPFTFDTSGFLDGSEIGAE